MARQLEQDDDLEGRLARATIELSNRHYFRAFAKWMRDPVSGGHEWTPEEREAVQRVRYMERAMALGAGGTGGFLVPYELDPSILIASAGSVSPLREIARVATTAQNEKRFVTSLGVTASWDLEAEEVSDDSPALLQPTITCHKGAAFVPASLELFEDSSIAQEIGTLFADAKNQHEALSFTLTQSQGPTGIISALVAAGGSIVIATGTNVLAQGDLYANQAALPARWRPNAKWMMNLTIINGYRQLPQATGLNYSIVNDDGPRPTALGWPIYENSSMDSTLTGAAADYLVLSGDFQQFAIVDRIGTSIEVVPHLFGTNRRPTGQRGFYMHYRSGSDVLIPDAFRLSNFST
jgi:HK97 family phage major capsid protein